MKINRRTRRKLRAAQDYCDEHDKSTEFMLEFMQDMANCDLDTVLAFLEEQAI